jgi:subtilisin family serine protease
LARNLQMNAAPMRPTTAALLTLVLAASVAGAGPAVPWGLDRIDQRALPLDGRFAAPGDGRGVNAYVVDTGVRRAHREFGGRVDWGGDFTTGTADRPGGASADDCDPPASPGHGTHVASILGGRTFGVARGVRIHALRILPCTGTTRTDYDAAVRAVNWITAHGVRPAVVNISAARWQTADRALDEAIARSIHAGFVYVLSAGGIADLDAFTPQRVPDAIKVGSTNQSDVAVQRGYGPHLTMFAPGVAIDGAGRASNSARFAADGDSYAAALVSGVVALYLQQHPNARPAEVKEALLAAATRGVVKDAGAAPNLLLHIVAPR